VVFCVLLPGIVLAQEPDFDEIAQNIVIRSAKIQP